jgi:hypothetical protein
MRLKQLLLVIGMVFSGSFLCAQVKIAQGLGLFAGRANVSGQARGLSDSVLTDCSYRLQLRQFGLVYTLRAELFQWKGGSVSIASPVMLGIGFTGNYNSTDFNGSSTKLTEGVKGSHLAFELPVVADLNIGMHSAADEKGSFGFYLGAGYAYSYTKLYSSVGKIPFDGFDPLVRAGIRMGRSWETRWGLVFSMRGSKSSTRMFGLQLLKEL